MKPLIVANWKLNPTSQKDAVRLFDAIEKDAKKSSAEVVICPPFVYLALFKGLTLGAQNVFYKEEGAFTGETSVKMLKDLNVEYVILGHSEVRKNPQETNEVINKKVKECLQEKLRPIVCVGEQEGEDLSEVLQRQVECAFNGVLAKEVKHVAIAYEPVWAIGTGKNCSVDQTMGSMLLIRKIISNLYNRETADAIKILYGGSVNGENSAAYIKEAGANGLLVGGASLKPEEFIKIIKSV